MYQNIVIQNTAMIIQKVLLQKNKALYFHILNSKFKRCCYGQWNQSEMITVQFLGLKAVSSVPAVIAFQTTQQ